MISRPGLSSIPLGEVRLPVRDVPTARRRCATPSLKCGQIAVLNWKRRKRGLCSLQESVVQIVKLAEHDGIGPSIRRDVMNDHEQRMRGFALTNKSCAQPWAAIEIERSTRLGQH